MKSDKEIKYCISGLLDLQGFSSHLEVSSDLRTVIGQQAISRLQILEEALKVLRKEQRKGKESFFFTYKRINDAIIFSIDLDDALLPSIGYTYKYVLTIDEWKKYYDIGNDEDDESFDRKYSSKRKIYTLPVVKFIGLISRIHLIVNTEEWKNNFPGAKTVISTGFRRSFIGFDGKEDYFSANFAFSNAYIAQEKLKGGGFYLDNNILQMLDADLHINNIAKLACLTYNNQIYSPLKDLKEPVREWTESDVTEISLFRKKYHFRRVNPNPLTYLQFIDDLDNRNDMYGFIIKNIQEPNIDEKIKQGARFNILKLPYDMGREMYNNRMKNSPLKK